MNDFLTELVAEDSTLVVSGNGLARYLQDIHALQQIESGKSAWQTPEILSWSVWCRQLWERVLITGDVDKSLIGSHQSLYLWQDIIQSSRLGQNLMQLAATARQAQQAYNICKQWQIDTYPEDLFLNDDAFAFKSWRESYDLRLKAKQLIDEVSLASELLQYPQILSAIKTRPVVFFGFDELAPDQEKLMSVVLAMNEDCRRQPTLKRNHALQVLPFQNEAEELQAMSDWVQHCYAEDENAQIGIIVPNLANKRQQIVEQLEKRLCIKNLLELGSLTRLPFSVAIGRRLHEYPMIAIALELLQLNAFRISVDSLSTILRSPYLSEYESEVANRHLLDAEVRQSGQTHISLKNLLLIHEELTPEFQCPRFIQSLTEFFEILNQLKGRHNCFKFTAVFEQALKSMQWPGSRTLDSDEYQTLESWYQAIQRFSQLDVVLKHQSKASAVALLRGIVREIRFQPRSPASRIHILDVAGASGMQFDYLWFQGLHDQQWPKRQTVNPFIPLQLQRSAGVPGAVPETIPVTAAALTDEIIESAGSVILSYPMTEQDRALRPSPLIRQRMSTGRYWPSLEDYADKLYQSRDLVQRIDATAPSIPADIKISGHSALFKDQSLCPFRAFAKHRLNAVALNDSDIGLSAIDRGLLLHRSMQLIWRTLKDSAQLRRLTEQVLNDRIQEAIKRAIDEASVRLEETFAEKFTVIEQQRLFHLIKDWLELEKQRSGFSVIATEKGHHVLFNNITLHMRIDRIDQLDDGRILIIDYKTGPVTAAVWEGERPADPQLPLYAVTTDTKPSALLFAKIKPGDSAFIGLAEDENILDKIKAPKEQAWQDKLEEWQSVLQVLADEYLNGIARVEPAVNACRICDLQSLCRIHRKQDDTDEAVQ